jgi:type I restriction enzyme S subunit
MSVLPEGWAVVPAGELGDWRGGGTPSKSNDAFWTGGTIPWVSPKDMKRQCISDAEDHITEAAIAGSATNRIPENSILIVTRSGILQHSLPVAINTVPVTVNQDLKALSPFEGILPAYVLRHLQADAQLILEAASKTGTTVESIDFDRLKAYPIRLAPFAEQKRIVAKVDGLTARTTRARADLDRIPTLIARYKQRLLALAFSGELSAGWRAEVGETPDGGAATLSKIAELRHKIRSERGLRNAGRNRSLSVQSPDLPDLPASWSWSIFNDCAWDLTVGHVGPMKERYVSEGIPFLRSLNVRENFVDLKNVVYIDEEFHGELKKSEIRAGELVVVRTGAPGTAAVVPETLGRANCSDLVIARLVPTLNPHYAAFYMNSEFAKSAVRGMQVGVAQQHFNVGAMSEMPIPIAPEHEQTEIVRRIESAFNWLDRMAADHAAAANLLPKLDAAILAKAFAGEIVPQDPNDEPASVLLERIREARSTVPKPKRQTRKPGTMKNKPSMASLLDDWPTSGMTFEELRGRATGTYDQIKEELFELMTGDQPKIRQEFDASEKTMRLKKVGS